MSDAMRNFTGSLHRSLAEPNDARDVARTSPYAVYEAEVIGTRLLYTLVGEHTGGDAVRLIAIACDRSGSVSPVRPTKPLVELPGPTRDPREALELIQSALGLSVTALATVMRVERPTIYAWLRASSTPTAANTARIERIAELAEYWLSISGGEAVNDLRAGVLDGKTLLELLSEEHLRTFATETAMRYLHKRSMDKPGQRPTLTEIARTHGISRDATEFDALTGRRLSEED